MSHNTLRMNEMNNIFGFVGGMLVGGLAGTITMLLLAPQSGEKTRADIRQKGIELRQHASDAVEDALEQTRDKAIQVREKLYDQAEAMQQSGQDTFDEQKERVSDGVEAGKAAVRDALK